jgi:purine-binding chemotaxis protein CheW
MRTFEVLKFARLRKVPKAPDFIEGMVNLRDQVVPVVDMRKRLGLPERSEGEMSRLLVVAIGNSRVALRVDDVPGVLELAPDAINPAPDLFRGLERRYLEGIAQDGERLMILLDLEEVLTSKERLALQELVEASETSRAESEPGSDGPRKRSKGKSSKSSKKKSSKKKSSKKKSSKKKKARRGKKKTAD